MRTGRVRILWLVLGARLLVRALPIGLYHRQVLNLSQEKLVDTERVQQNDLTRSLTQEIQFFETNLTQQLMSEVQVLALVGVIDNVEDPAAEPKVTRLLESFAESNSNTFLYVTAVGKSRKGTVASQGNFRADQDPFVAKALQRAYVWCMQQSGEFRSDPLALEPNDRPAFVVAVPLKNMNGEFTGMLAAVVSLEPVLLRLQRQRSRPYGICCGSRRAYCGAPQHQELRSRHGPEREFRAGEADSRIAARVAQHADDSLHASGEQSQCGDDRHVQHAAGDQLGHRRATQFEQSA
jgi:hypothetical protein